MATDTKNSITVTNITPPHRQWVESEAKKLGVSMGAIIKKLIADEMVKSIEGGKNE